MCRNKLPTVAGYLAVKLINLYTETGKYKTGLLLKQSHRTNRTQSKKRFENQKFKSKTYFKSLSIALLKVLLLLEVLLSLEVFSILDKASLRSDATSPTFSFAIIED